MKKEPRLTEESWIVTRYQLAMVLGVSRTSVDRWMDQGMWQAAQVPDSDPPRLFAIKAVQWRIAQLESKGDELKKLRRTRREQLELRIAREGGELVSVDKIHECWRRQAMLFRRTGERIQTRWGERPLRMINDTIVRSAEIILEIFGEHDSEELGNV